VSGDALGLMVIHPQFSGRGSIHLDWAGTKEDAWARGAQAAGVLILISLIVSAFRRKDSDNFPELTR
jgi:hypothetical protein